MLLLGFLRLLYLFFSFKCRFQILLKIWRYFSIPFSSFPLCVSSKINITISFVCLCAFVYAKHADIRWIHLRILERMNGKNEEKYKIKNRSLYFHFFAFHIYPLIWKMSVGCGCEWGCRWERKVWHWSSSRNSYRMAERYLDK